MREKHPNKTFQEGQLAIKKDCLANDLLFVPNKTTMAMQQKSWVLYALVASLDPIQHRAKHIEALYGHIVLASSSLMYNF